MKNTNKTNRRASKKDPIESPGKRGLKTEPVVYWFTCWSGIPFFLLFGEMSDNLSDMKAVGTRELQHETRSIRERVQGGESFLWKDRGRVVAIISPASEQREPKPWPNLRKRLADAREKAKSGAPSASAVIYRERG